MIKLLYKSKVKGSPMNTLIDTNEISIPPWDTPAHKIKRAYSDGQLHAQNHFYDIEPDPNFPFGVDNWAYNPYSPNRPGLYYAFKSGFYEEWAKLNRGTK
jgi:hypothetical protein